MQNGTLVKMAIALKRGEAFVEETKDVAGEPREELRNGRSITLYPRLKKAVPIAVRSRAETASLALVDDTIYDTGCWSSQFRLHQHEKKPKLLLGRVVPEFTYNQFGRAVMNACASMNVPCIQLRPELTHDQARAWWDFALWQIVRVAVRQRDSELEMNRILEVANTRYKDREVYNLFFGLRWPKPAKPDDFDVLATTLARKRIEPNKFELANYQREIAQKRGIVTPFWMK